MADDNLTAELARSRKQLGADDAFMSCPCGRGDYLSCRRCPYRHCSVHGIEARLLTAVDAVLELHKPFRIYDECDHGHTGEDIAEGRAVDTGEFVSCHEEFLYSICTECCRDAQGFQTEECADSHFHDITHCKTALAISRALTGEENLGG